MVNPGRFRTPTCRRSSASRRVSAENPVTLRDLGILADQAAKVVPAENLEVCAWSRWLPTSGRRALLQRPVRAMLVVVIDVLAEDQSQVPFAGYQHPVQALAAGTGDPPFGDSVRPRRLDRCFDDPHADGGEYGVEGRGELGVPVADQELQAASLVFEVHQEAASPGTGSPAPGTGASTASCTSWRSCSCGTRPGARACYDARRAGGMPSMMAMRAPKRRLSNVVFARLLAGQKRREASPGGQPGTPADSSAAGPDPGFGSWGSVLVGE
jgi:hypothetical protein